MDSFLFEEIIKLPIDEKRVINVHPSIIKMIGYLDAFVRNNDSLILNKKGYPIDHNDSNREEKNIILLEWIQFCYTNKGSNRSLESKQLDKDPVNSFDIFMEELCMRFNLVSYLQFSKRIETDILDNLVYLASEYFKALNAKIFGKNFNNRWYNEEHKSLETIEKWIPPFRHYISQLAMSEDLMLKLCESFLSSFSIGYLSFHARDGQSGTTCIPMIENILDLLALPFISVDYPRTISHNCHYVFVPDATLVIDGEIIDSEIIHIRTNSGAYNTVINVNIKEYLAKRWYDSIVKK